MHIYLSIFLVALSICIILILIFVMGILCVLYELFEEKRKMVKQINFDKNAKDWTVSLNNECQEEFTQFIKDIQKKSDLMEKHKKDKNKMN